MATRNKIYHAIGLMSGTSLDGIDAAYIETDGEGYVKPHAFISAPYTSYFRDLLRRCLRNVYGAADPFVRDVELQLTELHAKAVQTLLKKSGIGAHHLHMVGFHGQTIFHQPALRRTIQIGDGQKLADMVGIPVINDFRTMDMRAGGQGAPLVPLYHQALFTSVDKPVVVLNVGGVANITWLGADGSIAAFDTGPGNALIDDWMQEQANKPFDKQGAVAALGHVDWAHVRAFLRHEYFDKPYPKSLDRDAFSALMPRHLQLIDGAATLTAMTAAAVCRGVDLMQEKPRYIYVAGGGRHNHYLMKLLADMMAIPVHPVEVAGHNGDAMEAEAFAYLAVRSHLGLPLSLPTTTGALKPMTGGAYFTPHAKTA